MQAVEREENTATITFCVIQSLSRNVDKKLFVFFLQVGTLVGWSRKTNRQTKISAEQTEIGKRTCLVLFWWSMLGSQQQQQQ